MVAMAFFNLQNNRDTIDIRLGVVIPVPGVNKDDCFSCEGHNSLGSMTVTTGILGGPSPLMG